MELHQEPVSLFIEGIIVDEPLGIADGLAMVAALPEERRQALERFEVAQALVFALRKKPVVIATVEQIARVDRNGLSQRRQTAVRCALLGSSQGVLEDRDVERERSVSAP